VKDLFSKNEERDLENVFFSRSCKTSPVSGSILACDEEKICITYCSQETQLNKGHLTRD